MKSIDLTKRSKMPFFEVIAPLLSRCRVITLDRLTEEDISAIIDMALSDEQRGLGGLNIELAADARDYIVRIADGDARVALNSLEVAGSLVISRQKPDSPTTAGDITLRVRS
jgi:putative ATPase